MSDETNAVDGANPAAPSTDAPATEAQQEVTDTSAESEQGQEQERDEQGRFKPKAQERINELTRARRQAERERDALRQELESFRQQQPQQTSSVSDKPPTLADYNYDLDAFGVALAEHSAKQARAFAAQEFAQRQQHQTQEQIASSFEAKEKDYAAKNPDYRDSVEALQSSVRFDPQVVEVLARSDLAPALVHHLGKHLDKADTISRLPPLQAVYELAKLEAQLSAPRSKPVSNAPPPPPSVGGGAAPQKNPDRMSTEEWLAWRQANLKAK